MNRGWGVWVVLLCGCASSDEEVSRRNCERLRDHLVDLRLSEVAEHPPTGPGSAMEAGSAMGSATKANKIDLEQHRVAMKRALGDSFIGSCEKTMKLPELNCALAAPDTTAVAACHK